MPILEEMADKIGGDRKIFMWLLDELAKFDDYRLVLLRSNRTLVGFSILTEHKCQIKLHYIWPAGIQEERHLKNSVTKLTSPKENWVWNIIVSLFFIGVVIGFMYLWILFCDGQPCF